MTNNDDTTEPFTPARLKIAMAQFRKSRNCIAEVVEFMDSPYGSVRLAVSMSDDFARVECVARTVDPLPAMPTATMNELISALNEGSPISIDANYEPGRLYAPVDLPFDDFMSAPDKDIEMLFILAVPGAIFAALLCIEKLKSGKTVQEIIRENIANAMATSAAGGLSRNDSRDNTNDREPPRSKSDQN